MTFEDVRRIAFEFPGVEDGTCFHTPALRVRGKLLARLHDRGEDLILRMDRDTRAVLARVRPEVFHFDDHYVPYDWVMVRLSTVGDAELRDAFGDAWRSQAPKKLVAQHEAAATSRAHQAQ